MNSDSTKNPGIYIGCCGAYCKTCKPFIENYCKGCKIGYNTAGKNTGKRDINKSRCKIKLCCFRDKKLATCADCQDFASCKTIGSFHNKNGYKYKKYRQAIEYIRKNG